MAARSALDHPAELAVACGVDIGPPVGKYHSSVPLSVDAVLEPDADAVAHVHRGL
jgi:hypothetical protein